MNEIYIFDLDDTLSDTTQRQWVLNTIGDKNNFENTRFTRFAYMESLCVFDKPIPKYIDLFKQYLEQGKTVWIWSGRSSLFRKETIDWLASNTGYPAHFFTDKTLKMRELHDYSKSTDLKMSWWSVLEKQEQQQVAAFYDDNVDNINMWKSINKPAFLVTK